MSNCGFMGFFVFVSVSSSSGQTDSYQQSPKAEGVWNHPECLHQLQGQLSSGRGSTSDSFYKLMAPSNILDVLNAKKANTISFLVLVQPDKLCVNFMQFCRIFLYFRNRGRNAGPGVRRSVWLCHCLPRGHGKIVSSLAFVCDVMDPVGCPPAAKFHL